MCVSKRERKVDISELIAWLDNQTKIFECFISARESVGEMSRADRVITNDRQRK